MTPDVRWRCTNCDLIVPGGGWLQATNPFDPNDTIIGCPRCRCIDCFVYVCDEPGCTKDGSCGWPCDEHRYRHTCFAHSPMAKR